MSTYKQAQEDRHAASEAAAHWRDLADEAERMAAWDRERGIDASLPGQSPGDHRARQYRRTAEALDLEAKTGRPHCSICLLAHPNHEHPKPRNNR